MAKRPFPQYGSPALEKDKVPQLGDIRADRRE
jgi:hypothetical protein